MIKSCKIYFYCNDLVWVMHCLPHVSEQDLLHAMKFKAVAVCVSALNHRTNQPISQSTLLASVT